MVALRLVHLIENHSDELALGLLKKCQSSPRTHDLNKVPASELRDRACEIYRHLSDWLLHKKQSEIERLYVEIGQRRAAQRVELADVCWGIMLTKEHLWDFLEQQGLLKSAVEMIGELELLRLLDQFFDRALCFVCEGYEHAPVSHAA
jgi:hypothetical protein